MIFNDEMSVFRIWYYVPKSVHYNLFFEFLRATLFIIFRSSSHINAITLI